MAKTLKHLMVAAGLLTAVMALWPNSKADASTAMEAVEIAAMAPVSIPGSVAQLGAAAPGAVASFVGNTFARCPLIAAWNPDAGPSTGRVGPVSGYSSFNAESESTTPVWWCWHTGTTKANYQQVCRKRCSGCINGAAYSGDVNLASTDLFCVASSGTDAGVDVSVEYGR